MDKQGRIFGKLSIIDLIIAIAILGLAVSLGSKLFSKDVKSIISADTKFYTTFKVDKVRQYSIDAVAVGDVIYENHAAKLGKVVSVSSKPAYDIMKKNDGTVSYAMYDSRYIMYITLECVGSVNDKGYFVNGNRLVSEGGTMPLKSNKISTTSGTYKIGMTEEEVMPPSEND